MRFKNHGGTTCRYDGGESGEGDNGDENAAEKGVCDEGDEKFVVVERDAVVDEDAVVVHAEDASAADRTVVRAIGFVAGTDCAVAQ